jgi:hypothetical protein
MDELATRAGLSRKFGFKALRRTFGRILIEKGFSSEEITDILGYSQRHKTKPLYESADKSVDWETRATVSVSDEELIEALRGLYARLDEPLTVEVIEEEFEYSYQSLYNHFGGLQAAVDTAGIDNRDRHPNAIPRDDLVEELQRLARVLDRPPLSNEMNERGNYSKDAYFKAFESWDDALLSASLNPDDTNGYESMRISREELLVELRRLSNDLGKIPLSADIDDLGEYSSTVYTNRFESLDEARQLAGLLETN